MKELEALPAVRHELGRDGQGRGAGGLWKRSRLSALKASDRVTTQRTASNTTDNGSYGCGKRRLRAHAVFTLTCVVPGSRWGQRGRKQRGEPEHRRAVAHGGVRGRSEKHTKGRRLSARFTGPIPLLIFPCLAAPYFQRYLQTARRPGPDPVLKRTLCGVYTNRYRQER
ncbi:hypothetical protein AAFF_G00423880 [Aldrovandia affinis]|uniref:Uncharacterized protein n=1 Tax=Aldrovandia affinis TaxID=143900 RepID=A0AAD7X077_9TELE|nr:hypothetical protein AAFF_G00423880 [Aldrovandia affinis]